MARVVRGSDRAAAAGYLLAAADKYSLALHLNAANPQVCRRPAPGILSFTCRAGQLMRQPSMLTCRSAQ